MKKTTARKCNWAVTAYNDWREERLRTFNYDYPIYEANLNDLKNLDKANLQYVLCRFVPKVTRKRGDGPFPGKTLYQMIVAIQKHLWVNKINLVEGRDFLELKTVLDNVMHE